LPAITSVGHLDLRQPIVGVETDDRSHPMRKRRSLDRPFASRRYHRRDHFRMAREIPLGERSFGQRPAALLCGHRLR